MYKWMNEPSHRLAWHHSAVRLRRGCERGYELCTWRVWRRCQSRRKCRTHWQPDAGRTRTHCGIWRSVFYTDISPQWLNTSQYNTQYKLLSVCLNGLVVSTLGIRARWPGFDSRVAPLCHWVATLGKLFTHIASPVSQLQETGVQREFSVPKWLCWLSEVN